MQDASIAKNIDVEAAILRCLENVKDQSDIILDAIMLDGEGLEVITGEALPEGHGYKDIEQAMKKYPDV